MRGASPSPAMISLDRHRLRPRRIRRLDLRQVACNREGFEQIRIGGLKHLHQLIAMQCRIEPGTLQIENRQTPTDGYGPRLLHAPGNLRSSSLASATVPDI